MHATKSAARLRSGTSALLALSLLTCTTDADSDSSPSAIQVIEESNRYHDPEGRWFSSTNRVLVQQIRQDVGDRIVDFKLYPASDQFEISMREESDSVAGRVNGAACDVPDSILPSAIERFGNLDCEGVLWWRGYYSYQFSAPMHLNDVSATVDSSATIGTFLGEPVYSLRVTYGQGQPVWDYYFDRSDFRLRGARFSSDGLGRDGEYIVLMGEAMSGRIRIASRRSWYMNADSSLVGEDIVIDLQSSTPDV